MTTNLVATVSASIITVVVTNWATVGRLTYYNQPTKSFLVQSGVQHTNTYVVFPWQGTNEWRLISGRDGPKLRHRRIMRQLPTAPHVPPPLPINPIPTETLTNVGTLDISQ